MLVYLVLNIVLVKGLSSGLHVQEFKNSLGEVFHGRLGSLAVGVTVFGSLLGTTSSAPNDQAGSYQSILLVIVSLAVIWALRQRLAGEKITARDAFYKGMRPLIPYLIVMFIIVLQLMPLFLAVFLYQPVFSGGLAGIFFTMVLLYSCAFMPRRRAIRSSIGGWVLKSDARPLVFRGLAKNKCAVEEFCLRMTLPFWLIFSRARARPSG